MTQQESFKRRIRARMEKTGERYLEARRVLIETPDPNRRRTWVTEPEMGDDAIREGTGKGWEDWCDIIDAWPGHDDGHTAIASYVIDELGVDPWWGHGVVVGYERITGRRMLYQRPDGTFAASKSRTVAVDAAELRAMILDDDARADLFPGHDTTLRSKPTSKSLRITLGPGTAEISLSALADGRTKVAVEHAKLPTFDEVEEWRFYWNEWLDALDDS